MAGEGFSYYYRDASTNKDLIACLLYPKTSCRLIGQPTVTWDNLGSLFFKHNDYRQVIDCLLDPNSNVLNGIRFCEKNPNCVEIEIDKGMHAERGFSGHHIFASCPVDLTKLIGSNSVNKFANVAVRWIHNYGADQETTLDEFLKIIQDLKTDQQKCGIAYKRQCSPDDTFEKLKHLSFLLDMRRYCGDISGLNHDSDKSETSKELIEYVNLFHKNHIETNIQPTRQIVWTFLHNLRRNWGLWQHAGKNLDWKNVKGWVSTINDLQNMVNAFQKIHPDLDLEQLQTPTTETELIERATDLIQKRQNQDTLDQIIGLLKSVNPAFQPTVDPVACTTFKAKFQSIVHQYTAFLKKEYFVQNAYKLIEKNGCSPVKENVVFAIYEQLFKTQIISELKNPESNTANILSFLFSTIQENGIVASISVPMSPEINKKLIIVVNDVQETDRDLKKELYDLVKGKSLPMTFLYSQFSILLDNQKYTDTGVGLVEATRIFKSILTDDNVDRIDGELVRERIIREKAAETWTEGVTAATRLLMLSHVFLTGYYDKQDYHKIFETKLGTNVQELIETTTKLLTSLRTRVEQTPDSLTNQATAPITFPLFQLMTHIETILKIMSSAMETQLQKMTELNKLLLWLNESIAIQK